jgi:hypothetical protein
MDFLEKQNHDDIFFRSLFVGLIAHLNNHITYPQVGADGIEREIFIPFLPTLTGDEPFIQDNFLDYGDCDGNPAFAEGNYDVTPRGIVEEGACQIITSSSTNKFVRATYMKEIPDGKGGAEMKAFSAYLAPIPLSHTYNIKIRVNTENEIMKIKARIVEVLFKNFVYYFSYKNIRIPAQATMPENVGDGNKLFNYSYGTSRENVTISFAITIETYLPQLDKSSERFRGNLMQGGIKLRTSIGDTTTGPDGRDIIKGIDVTKRETNVNYGPSESNDPGNIKIT